MLNKFLDLLDLFVKKTGKISSILILMLICFVSISVILRYIFSIGFIWLQDLYIWVHSLFILMGIAFTLNSDEHVRIDLLYRSLKKNKKRVNFVGAIFFGIPFSIILIINGLEYFLRSLQLNEGSKETGGLPYIFILKFFIFFFGLLLFLELIRQILRFLNKND